MIKKGRVPLWKSGLPSDLHCHSTFSILDGIGQPEAVVDRAVALGWQAVALTEHGNIMSAPILYKAAKAKGIKPILGTELYVVNEDDFGKQDKNSRSYHLTTLALSKEGYHNLVAWSTFANKRDDQFQNFYRKPRISLGAMVDVAPYPMHHNVIFSGCLSSELLRFYLECPDLAKLWTGAEAYISAMKTLFPNFYLELQNHRVDKYSGRGFISYDGLLETEARTQQFLLELSRRTGTPLIVTNDSHMQTAAQRKPHLAMKLATWKHHEGAMDYMSDSAIAKELETYSYFGNFMRSMDEVADDLPKKIAKQALGNITGIAQEANIELDILDRYSYSIPFSGYSDPISRLRKRSKKRLEQLKDKHGQVAVDRFEHELSSMGDFAHYLLIVSDLISNWKKQGIFTHTRGSAANSILCFCIGIHNVDSIYFGLTFERFYNPSRKKLPDVDIDIDPTRYDDAIRFTKEYMAEREGEGNVERICNYGTLANRSAFRLIAESQGISKEVVDEVSKLLPSMIDSGMVDEEEAGFELIKEEFPDVYELTAGVFDSIKSVSQHACAWILGTKKRPIEKWIPLCLIASSNTSVTQYNYKILDKYFGLVKLDVLRLKTLSVIKKTIELANLEITEKEDIPLDDKDTFNMFCAGDTDGVHSFQGKTQRQGCLEVRPRTIFDLVAIQALYRPSGTRTGFDKVFVKRRRGEEKIPKIHPLVDSILLETYGLPIYQEQALDIGYAIGFSHEEAQKLLDAIKMAKGVGRGAAEAFEALWPLFWKRAKKVGIKEEKAREVFKLLDAFQGYGFNCGHATSYALLGYYCAYLKCHHKLAFDTATLEVFPEKSRYIAMVRHDRFEFEPPNVNESQAGFSLGDFDNGIRVGLSRIKGLGPVAIEHIVAAQPFTSFDDFRKRLPGNKVNKARVEVLSAVGALSALGVDVPEEFVVERKEKGQLKRRVYKGQDMIEYHLLGFCLATPQAFDGLKPRYTKPRQQKNSEWSHKGYERGVELTEGPVSISKMFWIPPLPKEDLYERKASMWARINTYLLKVIDENGIVFQVKVNENKEDKVIILDVLARKCRGSAVCLDGAIRSPFTFDGPLTFQLFNVTGAWQDDPQIFMNSDKVTDIKEAIIHISRNRGKHGTVTGRN